MKQMKIIIVGDGKVGLAITAQLSKEGHDLMVIDSQTAPLEQSAELYDVMTVQGNGASLPVLREAGAATADLLIAATSMDELNMLTCILARRLGTKNTIARVRNPEYAEQLHVLRDELGLSMTVNPELSAATEMFHIIQFPSFLRRETFAKGRAEIVEFRIGSDSKLKDIPLCKMYQAIKVNALVCAVEREGEAFIPGGDFVLRENDKIHVTAAYSDLVRLISSLELEYRNIKNAIIIGGSRIAYYLASMLCQSGISVKVIERDPARCLELADLLPGALIIEGDGNQQRLLMEEGMRETDAVVTLTNLDEQNIFLSLFALHTGVPKVITKVSLDDFSGIIQEMGLDSVVVPKSLCATEIVRYVRAMSGTSGGSVIAMSGLAGGKVEALEFLATSSTKHLGKKLCEAQVQKNHLVACIIREGKAFIPRGNDCIQENDSVIVVTPSGRMLSDLNEIFIG